MEITSVDTTFPLQIHQNIPAMVAYIKKIPTIFLYNSSTLHFQNFIQKLTQKQDELFTANLSESVIEIGKTQNLRAVNILHDLDERIKNFIMFYFIKDYLQ